MRSRALSAAAAADAPAANVHLEEELGDLLFQIVFHARLGAEDGVLRPGRGGPDRARQAGAPAPPRLRRRRRLTTRARSWRTGRRSSGARRGARSVTEGIPAALPALVLREQARPQGAFGRRRAARPSDVSEAAADLAALARRAERATPHPDDPLVRDERRRAADRRAALRDREPRAAPRRRRGTGAAGRAPSSLRDDIRAPRASPMTRRATANLVIRCPTRADTEGVTW